jgi:hypothetical protein
MAMKKNTGIKTIAIQARATTLGACGRSGGVAAGRSGGLSVVLITHLLAPSVFARPAAAIEHEDPGHQAIRQPAMVSKSPPVSQND